MRLLPKEAFAHVITPLQGKRIGFVRPGGNVGDDLIEQGMRQLFDEYGIQWRIHDPNSPADDLDELVFGGGGNMGTMYRPNWVLREQCLATGRPMTVLPQSWTSPEDRQFHRVYVRERKSLALASNGILAPDLALGLDFTTDVEPIRKRGVFLRKDKESVVTGRWWRRDPIKMCRTPQEYLELAARYEHVVTDRLHFAICSMIVGRRTTLLPNSYHKNIGMFETWLGSLGCEFAGTLRQALRRTAA